MIKKTIVSFKDGSTKTQIRVVKSARIGENKSPRQITVKSFGYLEDQIDITSFWNEVNRVNESILETRKKNIVLTIPTGIANNDEINKQYNYGYRYIEAVLQSLHVKEFFDTISFKGDYSLYEVFEFLVYQRILAPASKRADYRTLDRFYGKKLDFSLADVYRSLDKFSDISVGLQTHLNGAIKKQIGRDGSYSYYDVTNYYFERDFNGEAGAYQKKGVSKEHRLNPIVQFGLFMDSNSIPIAMKAYPGNTSDSVTLQPAMQDIKKDFRLGRLIVVADKGLNSSSNIDYICNNGDGYVVSQTLRGKKGNRYHSAMFDADGYVGNDDFRYKIYEEEYESNINSRKKVMRRRKVLIYWSREDAEYAKAKRNEKVRNAENSLTNNAYGINHTKSEYIATQYFASESGEISDARISGIDYDKVKEDEKYDGYFCIITSELDYDFKKILEVYRNLWHIEESFRITKSDLNTRPIYVSTNKHIDGHFLICFVALTVIRLLQYKMKDEKISAERIKSVLKSCTCKLPAADFVWLNEVFDGYSYLSETKSENIPSLTLDTDNDYIRNDWLTLQKLFNINLDTVILERSVFNKALKLIKF